MRHEHIAGLVIVLLWFSTPADLIVFNQNIVIDSWPRCKSTIRFRDLVIIDTSLRKEKNGHKKVNIEVKSVACTTKICHMNNQWVIQLMVSLVKSMHKKKMAIQVGYDPWISHFRPTSQSVTQLRVALTFIKNNLLIRVTDQMTLAALNICSCIKPVDETK